MMGTSVKSIDERITKKKQKKKNEFGILKSTTTLGFFTRGAAALISGASEEMLVNIT